MIVHMMIIVIVMMIVYVCVGEAVDWRGRCRGRCTRSWSYRCDGWRWRRRITVLGILAHSVRGHRIAHLLHDRIMVVGILRGHVRINFAYSAGHTDRARYDHARRIVHAIAVDHRRY